MLHQFLEDNTGELIDMCRAKVALRLVPPAMSGEMLHGVPLFLTHLIETLRVEGEAAPSRDGTRAKDGLTEKQKTTPLSIGAKMHGLELLHGGYTVDQVVHDYGDLCQAITELAIKRSEPIRTDEFQTLNLCLDNAIAAAVTEFDYRRDQLVADSGNRVMNERLGFLAHELRNSLGTAMLAVAAIKRGGVGTAGATAGLLDRSHLALRDLIERTLSEVRLGSDTPAQLVEVAVDQFIAEFKVSASLEATSKGCQFVVEPIEAGLLIRADLELLASALANLVQNACKFTKPCSQVTLRVFALGDRVLFEVEDQCGGLPAGKAANMFATFQQYHADRSGLGLGLSIAQRAVKANDGEIRVNDLAGRGCIFTIDLPLAGQRNLRGSIERGH